MTVESWKERIKHIRYQSNIEKTNLQSIRNKEKPRDTNDFEDRDRDEWASSLKKPDSD